MFEKTLKLYNQLAADAEGDMFEGSMAGVYKKTHMSQSHYSKLFGILIETGCIELVRRGRGPAPSQIRLRHAPTEKAVRNSYQAGRLTKRESPARVMLEQRVSIMEGRLSDIDLVEALSNIERRLAALEREVTTDAKAT